MNIQKHIDAIRASNTPHETSCALFIARAQRQFNDMRECARAINRVCDTFNVNREHAFDICDALINTYAFQSIIDNDNY